MIPGNPRQMPPVGAPAGLHVEIAARCQNLRPLVPFGVDDDEVRRPLLTRAKIRGVVRLSRVDALASRGDRVALTWSRSSAG